MNVLQSDYCDECNFMLLSHGKTCWESTFASYLQTDFCINVM